MRERLDAMEADGSEGLILLTPLEPTPRLRHHGPAAARSAGPKRSLGRAAGAFRVRDVDPRLRAQRWLADLLIERLPVGGYPPAPGGMLDLDTAWRALQEQVLGLPAGRADATALLEWTLDWRSSTLREPAGCGTPRVAERLAGAGGPAPDLCSTLPLPGGARMLWPSAWSAAWSSASRIPSGTSRFGRAAGTVGRRRAGGTGGRASACGGGTTRADASYRQ